MSQSWVPVVPTSDVQGPPWRLHDVAGTPVRVLRGPDGTLHAIGPSCPHLDAPLDRAEIEGDDVLCPRHWYSYDLDTGANTHPGRDPDCRLATFPVRVVDGVVEVATGRQP